ncbi:MAG: tetratricopeptide repeat protein [Gemmatimonadetes bacterium]|nr:tetratricopeptide repeat protein [Gemmatimonadota bacterium]
MTTRRRFTLAAALFVFAFAVRLWHIGWGLPGVYEEGFALERAWGFWNWGGAGFDWNPHWFNYPTLYSYMQFAVQWLVRTAGPYADAEAFRAAFTESRAGLVLPGRILAAFLGAMAAPLVFLAAFRFTTPPGATPAGALLAGSIVAVHSVHVEKSRFLEVDVPTAFFLAVAFYCVSRFLAGGRRLAIVLAAAAVGLAASTKYPAAVFLPNVLAAPWFVAGMATRRRVALTMLLGAVALAAFFAGTPYALLDFTAFQEGLQFESRHVRVGHLGGQGAGIVGAARAFSTGYGPLLSLLLVASFVWLIARRRREAALLLPGIAIVFALLALSSLQPAHYALPALPAAALAIGVFYGAFVPKIPRFTGFAVFAILLLWPVSAVRERAELLAETDSRTAAAAWIEQKIAPGRITLTEAHGPQLLVWEETGGARPRFRVLTMPLFPVEPNRADRFYDPAFVRSAELVVTVGAVRERYEAEPDRFPRQVATYRELETAWIPLHTFPSSGLGSTIRLYGRAKRTFAEAPPIRFAPEARADAEFGQFARNLIQYLLDRGRSDEALRLAEALAAFAPAFAENRALHATILSSTEPDRALAMLQQSYAQNPDDATIAKNLAVACFQTGDYARGIAVLESMVGRGAGDAEIHGNLANAYLITGNDAAALRHFRRFLALAPNHPRAPEIREQVHDLSTNP